MSEPAVELPVTEARHRKAAVEQILVEDHTTDTALEHGRLLAHIGRIGKPRGAHDLIIAATASSTGRTVVTGDRAAHFADLPGVDLLLL